MVWGSVFNKWPAVEFSKRGGEESTSANSKSLSAEIFGFFFFPCFSPFVIVTFTERFGCRDLTLTSRTNNISMLWIQNNGHILYVEVFTLVILRANVAEPQTKEGTHGYWSYPMPEQLSVPAAAQKSTLNVPLSFTPVLLSSSPPRASHFS